MKKSLVDTCGWVEWLTNGEMVNHFEPYLKNVTQLIIPTLVQYELYKWICREKDQEIAFEIIGVTEKATIAPLDTNLALYAADIAKQHGLAMADAIIYATARKYDVDLITSDKHFRELPRVKYFSKKYS